MFRVLGVYDFGCSMVYTGPMGMWGLVPIIFVRLVNPISISGPWSTMGSKLCPPPPFTFRRPWIINESLKTGPSITYIYLPSSVPGFSTESDSYC